MALGQGLERVAGRPQETRSVRPATSPKTRSTAWGDVAILLVRGVLPAGAAAADFALCRQNRLRHPFGEISRPTSGSLGLGGYNEI